MEGQNPGASNKELYPKSEITNPREEVLRQLREAEEELSNKDLVEVPIGMVGSLGIRNQGKKEALKEIREKIRKLEEEK